MKQPNRWCEIHSLPIPPGKGMKCSMCEMADTRARQEARNATLQKHLFEGELLKVHHAGTNIPSNDLAGDLL